MIAVVLSKDDNDFKEQKFTVSGLEPFSAFSLKIVLTGTIKFISSIDQRHERYCIGGIVYERYSKSSGTHTSS